jgi:hypothetical protein
MSYAIDLIGRSCPTCGHVTEPPNLPDPTYNLWQIFDLALAGEDKTVGRPRGLKLLHGREAESTVAQLQEARTRLADPALEPRFRALEPSNRWGTLEDARRVIGLLLAAAEKYPADVWSVR